MIEGTREPIKQLYNVTDEYINSLNYHHYERMTDTAVALNFEGHPAQETYFSDDQWELNHEFQKVYLEGVENKNSRDLMISRLLRKPLKEMQTKVNDLLAGNSTTDLKYMIYSAHDDQVV